MRINSPITDREYCFGQNETLVSVTDTKGHITYCNPAFLEVSGFAEAELLGQAHNIIRHPDMPSAAFFDLWATIRAGQPWTGIVKNRRKDGDFYWVQANVTPLRAGDEITGYLSVRTLATRTAEAARNIRQLIGQSTERVSSGNDATSAALARMHETLQAVAQVDTVLGEINAAAREQQQGIEQINHAIADLDNITSQNAALVRQVHAATQALRTQADNVCSTMRLLRLEASEQSLSQRNARELRQRCRAA